LVVLGGQIPDSNLAVLGFGLVALLLLLLAEKFLPGRPAALFVVAASIVVLSLTSLGEMGFSVVGALPQGLPEFQFPALRARDIDGVVPLAFACLLLSYVESVSAARALAEAHKTRIDPRQEFLGLGAANLGAALFQAYPVAGGLSQSSVNDKAGAKTPLALVFASLTIGLCLMFLTGLLKNLPNVVLAAVVLVAVKGLVNIGEMKRLWRVSREEFLVSMIAFAAVLLLGILNGVIVAVVASLLLLIRRSAHPHVALLGRIPGSRAFSDRARHPESIPVPGALVVRVDEALLYFNAEHVRDTVWQSLRAEPGSLKMVIWDLSTSPHVDMAGARMLAKLHRELAEAGVKLRLVSALPAVRELLRAEGLEESIDYFGRQTSVADVVDELQSKGRMP
jgi:sulfate permease, SulP family